MDKKKEIALIVAHPDDETIWAGGTVLMRKDSSITILSLCRGSDPERAPKFHRAVRELGARGAIGDLDDGPDQTPLKPEAIRHEILALLPKNEFDLVLTHSPFGEYTRHRRHEETGEAIASMWEAGEILTPEIWIFAYCDRGKGGVDDPATPAKDASRFAPLPEAVWQKKRDIITGIYGFNPGSYEVKIAQQVEAFWSFGSPSSLRYWIKKRRILS